MVFHCTYEASCCCFHSSMRRLFSWSRSSSLELDFSSSSNSLWMLCHFFTNDGIFVLLFFIWKTNFFIRLFQDIDRIRVHRSRTVSNVILCVSESQSTLSFFNFLVLSVGNFVDTGSTGGWGGGSGGCKGAAGIGGTKGSDGRAGVATAVIPQYAFAAIIGAVRLWSKIHNYNDCSALD